MGSSVAALLVSHDGSRWLPAVLEGLSAQHTPVDAVVAVDTGSKDDSADLLERAFGEVVRAPGSTSFPAASTLGLERMLVSALDQRVGLDPPRRREPRPRGARRAARRGRGRPGGRRPRPEAARVALAAAAARARRHHLRHRPARDRARARRVRPGPARRGARGARGQHRRHAGAPLGARGARRLRRRSCRSSATTSTSAGAPPRPAPHRRGAAGRRLPRRGRAPRRPPYAADRSAHALPGATGRALHAARQRPRPGAAVAGGPAGLRHAAADARLPAGPLGRRGARRPGRAAHLYAHPGEIRRPPRRGAPRGGDPERARPLLAPWWVPYRHGLDFLGDLVTAATNQASDVAERRRLAAAEHAPASTVARPRDRGGRARRGHRRGRAVPHQPGRPGPHAVRARRAGRRPRRRSTRSPAAGCRRPRPGSRTGGGCSSRPGTRSAPARRSPRRRTSCRWRCSARCCSGSPTAAVSAVLLLAVPLGLWGAWRFLRVAGRLVTPAGAPRWVLLWGATT